MEKQQEEGGRKKLRNTAGDYKPTKVDIKRTVLSVPKKLLKAGRERKER